ATAGDDDVIQGYLCDVAVSTGDINGLRRCSAALERTAPDEVATPYFKMMLALFEQRWSDARRNLERAHALGFPEEGYRHFAGIIDQEEPATERWLPVGVWAAAYWAGGMIVLLIFGLILSAVALRASRRVPTEKTGHVRGFDALLRKIYRVVLW